MRTSEQKTGKGKEMKIDIAGSVASGKTTLAESISRNYQIPCYEKDNIVWSGTAQGDVKRTPKERDELFQSIISVSSRFAKQYTFSGEIRRPPPL